MDSTSVTFCAIIVNYNGREDTIACVNSVLEAAQNSSTDVRLLVVDNSFDDFDFHDEAVTVLRTGHNIGLSGAWYVGVFSEIAQSCDYIMFLNNDAVVAGNFFSEMLKGVRTWGEDCAFGPRIYFSSDATTIWSRGGKISRYMVSIKHFGENVPSTEVQTSDFETGHLSGCCMVVRTAHLNELGGPDTNFFFRGEEWDLNYRLREIGVRLFIIDRAHVFHQVNGSHDRFEPKMLYFAYRAKMLFAKKILPRWYFPFWLVAALLFSVLRSAPRFSSSSDYTQKEIRSALISAILDGLRRDKILPPKQD